MNRRIAVALFILILATLACTQSDEADTTREPDTADEPEPISQWADSATASTEYGSDSWSAEQATGAPDTDECGDMGTAWASSGWNTEDWLELTYDTPVYATEVNIFQTYNPDQVVLVELIDVDSNYHEVYSGSPEEADDCPYTLSIDASGVDEAVDGIRITIDQSVLEDWNEIDAVELVGVPAED